MDKLKAALAFIWKWVKAFFKALGNLVLRYPLATALTVLLVAAAAAMLAAGKTFQIGGILGKLWGRKKEVQRGVPPEDRKDADGKVIPPGTPDEKGYVQAPVSTEIVEPGIFSDPDVVTVVHPEKGTIDIALPTGVKNEDVTEVTEIQPNVYEVRNNDKKSVDPGKVLDMLEKKKR